MSDEGGPSASELREQGNGSFKQGDYSAALRSYTAALEAGGEAVALNRNLAATYLKLNLPGPALEAANACLELQPDDAKAKYRIVQALAGLDSVLAAWVFLQTLCDDLLYAAGPAKNTEWQKLETQCAKGLGLVHVHPALRVKEVSDAGRRFAFVCATDVEAGAILMQESRYCRNKEQEDTDGGVASAVAYMLRIWDEGGLNKYQRELRGLHPAAASDVPDPIWEQTCRLVRQAPRAPADPLQVDSIALLAHQFNCNRFEDALYRCSSYFAHSCAPNCDRDPLLNNDLRVVALRPIPAGEVLTVSALPFEGLLAGAGARRRLLQSRLWGPCPCHRCGEDWGGACPGPHGYGGTGEAVRCQAEGCQGYAPFPALEVEDQTSEPCPVCARTTTHHEVAARFHALSSGLAVFLPSGCLAPGATLPTNSAANEEVRESSLRGYSRLQELRAEGVAWLHPQHHLLRLVHWLSLKIAQAVFSVEYSRAFGQRSIQRATPTEFVDFLARLGQHRLLEVATGGLEALTGAGAGAGAGGAAPPPPVSVRHTALAEGHAVVVDTLCVFAAERELPHGFDSDEQLREEVERRLPYCPPKVQKAARQVLQVLSAEEPGELATELEAERSQEERAAQRAASGNPEVDEQEAIAELLRKIQGRVGHPEGYR